MAGRGRISLGERVYHAMRRDLAAGAIVPTERLREERLAEIYGVSRTPVREALARLQADGLVERQSDGLYPYRPRLGELDQLYELRILLEARGIQRVLGRTGAPSSFPGWAPWDPAAAHDLSLVHAELDTWKRLRDNPPEPGPALVAADEQFHTTLLAAAGNRALTEALSAVYIRVRPVRTLDLYTTERIAAMTDDHITIAEHLLSGDPDTALRALLAHLEMSRTHVLARAQQALEFTKLGRAMRD
ncbi:GntR family transcriptional regulator [Nocardia sp. XZ_19_385]|uniref:GntR family transcriptional regulator n=1 Tax=Nocardia sp. XZ_19_385 TaxID=2769488 RepID=UPI00188EB875|nr:GntR family transcriptional regulator [Nocardia sp. XZ_19_385]